ncbi:Leucine-rich repeat domain superfamily [Babesia duncani]|uniref:Leucine-rich repeat domain superfamily n=1 Tax=Babesia duncani TaxID=323732 RepID=A0AAD9UR30_9APIC|nr:Leucine-rich repeat domain superfamily [Babesia duncani]
MTKRKREDKSTSLSDINEGVLRYLCCFCPQETILLNKCFYNIVAGLRRRISTSKGNLSSHANTSLAAAILSSRNITHLNISNWQGWNDALVTRLIGLIKNGHYKRLAHLYMRNCNGISNDKIRALVACIGPSLKTLDLFNCKGITFYSIPPHVKNLETLCLGNIKSVACPQKEGTDVLQYLFGNDHGIVIAPKIKNLTLHKCPHLKSLSHLKAVATSLKLLDITNCDAVPLDHFRIIATCRNLQELYLGTFIYGLHAQIGIDVGTTALIDIIENCTKLRALDISNNGVDETIAELIVSKLQNLQRLGLANSGYFTMKCYTCRTLNNAALVKLLYGLPKLEILDVSNCWRLTSRLSSHFTSSIPDTLQLLSVYQCSLDVTGLSCSFLHLGKNVRVIAQPLNLALLKH